MLKYADIVEARIAETYPHGRNQQGYGRKITTNYMVKTAGSNRWRRVYCCIFGNSGTLYIESKGKPLYIHEEDLKKMHKKVLN